LILLSPSEELKVINDKGQIIEKISGKTNHFYVDLSNFAPGMYILETVEQGIVSRFKVISF
jgi:hypothetical protein